MCGGDKQTGELGFGVHSALKDVERTISIRGVGGRGLVAGPVDLLLSDDGAGAISRRYGQHVAYGIVLDGAVAGRRGAGKVVVVVVIEGVR